MKKNKRFDFENKNEINIINFIFKYKSLFIV